MAGSHEGQESRHPTFRQYLTVAVVLFVITIVEFLLIYPRAGIVDYLGPSKIPLLVGLSAIKFAIVIMFYMHLKFDNRLFGSIFMSGLILGFAVVVAVLTLFFALQGNPRAYAEARAQPYEGHAAEEVDHPVEEPETGSASTEAGATTAAPEGSDSSENATTPADSGPAPSASRGQEIFAGVGGCAACHTIEGVTAGLVGPNLTKIGADAASRRPGLSAKEYITESIRTPEAFVATGVELALAGVMTAALTEGLSDAQVEDLVEFLLAQN